MGKRGLVTIAVISILSATTGEIAQGQMPNCTFNLVSPGVIVAIGKDLGTIGAENQPLVGLGSYVAQSAVVNIQCNHTTAVYVHSPMLVVGNHAFMPVEAKTVASFAEGSSVVGKLAVVSNMTIIDTKSPDYFLIQDPTKTYTASIDINLRNPSGIPVGEYEYDVKITASQLD